MAWRIEFDPSAEKELAKLGREQVQRILKFLSERVAKSDDPRGVGEALKGSKLATLSTIACGGSHSLGIRISSSRNDMCTI
jgi:mRNA-degrading endonuclease RelE of RelBE toxin-antitoxin system